MLLLFLTVSVILAAIWQLELARESPPFPVATWRGSSEAEQSVREASEDSAAHITAGSSQCVVTVLLSLQPQCVLFHRLNNAGLRHVHRLFDECDDRSKFFHEPITWLIPACQIKVGFRGGGREEGFSHTEQSSCIASLQPRETLKTAHVHELSLGSQPSGAVSKGRWGALLT